MFGLFESKEEKIEIELRKGYEYAEKRYNSKCDEYEKQLIVNDLYDKSIGSEYDNYLHRAFDRGIKNFLFDYNLSEKFL